MEIKNRHASRTMADVGVGRIVAAFAALGAAAIHIAAAADHYAQWWLAGVFFYAVGAFQAGWAVAALRASGSAVMLLGLLANAGVIATWTVSRTVGVPVGPSTGVSEDITRADVTAAAFEVVICLLALWHVRRRAARGFASSLGAVVLVGITSAAVTGMTMPALESAVSHSHSHGTAEEPLPHGGDRDDAEPQETRPGTDPTPSEESPEGGHGHDDEPHGH